MCPEILKTALREVPMSSLGGRCDQGRSPGSIHQTRTCRRKADHEQRHEQDTHTPRLHEEYHQDILKNPASKQA